MTTDSAFRAWSWRHAFASAQLPAMTKLVLHTLGMFMNELGENCYPSIADICTHSGLDKKTVLKHLAIARDKGWIAVSQHGYRGQRWKRQEYAPRWPERDLTSTCLPDEGQGGGAVPPPSDAVEVVEFVPEGGGNEGSKVVEQFHQDKILPNNIPINIPVERERGREDREESLPAENAGRDNNRKNIEADGWALLKNWPGFAGMPKDRALAAWMRMTAEDRAEAKRKFPAWLALLKSQKKSHIPAPSTYFEQRLFADVPEPTAETQAVVITVPVWGKVWAAARLVELLKPPSGIAPMLTAFERSQVAAGRASEADLLRVKRARHGWPAVNAMHDRAGYGGAATVPSSLQPLAEMMESVRVDSDLWEAWKREHEDRGWPWLPDTGNQDWVCFPAGGPVEGLARFEAAVRGGTDMAAE